MNDVDGPDDPKGFRRNLLWEKYESGKNKLMENRTREEGYYWVKYTHEWIVAEWFNGEWTLFNAMSSCLDSDFDEIDENRIVRQPALAESELETIASDQTGNEDDYKGFIRGYKYAKHGKI